jgi:cytosine/adenosine deaminase-related metal-dependent hydrolase
LNTRRMSIVTHRAKWIIISPERIVEDGYVTVGGGKVLESGRGKGPKDTRTKDHGFGVMMPALVNAHTHLDLTPLAGTLPTGHGFVPWVEEVITGKAALTDEDIAKGIVEGRRLLLDSGCALAGDHRSFRLRDNSREKPVMHVFHEYLGSDFPRAGIANGNPFSSLAAHAPHTTAPALIRILKDQCRQRNQVFSMHVAESLEEREFITGVKGNWAEFLTGRGISFAGWGLPAPSPVRHLERLGVLDERTLAVHLVETDKGDLEILKQKGVCVCLCPRSNRNLLARLPDVKTMLDMGMQPALGTDSLASVSSLDLFAEMRFLANEVPDIPPREIVAMGTVNGAQALHREETWGTLEPGKQADILFASLQATRSESLLESLLDGALPVSPEWVI